MRIKVMNGGYCTVVAGKPDTCWPRIDGASPEAPGVASRFFIEMSHLTVDIKCIGYRVYTFPSSGLDHKHCDGRSVGSLAQWGARSH